jgi:hypothetical protein
MESPLTDRRAKRSTDYEEALQFLVEAVADRSGVPALVLVDHGGRIVAGMGMPDEVAALALSARYIRWRRATPHTIDKVTGGRDVTARSFVTRDGRLTFAALSEGMTGLGEAVRAVRRILTA